MMFISIASGCFFAKKKLSLNIGRFTIMVNQLEVNPRNITSRSFKQRRVKRKVL